MPVAGQAFPAPRMARHLWMATVKSLVSDNATMLQGAVINVSSVGALVPMGSPSMCSYGVAKAAQDQLTKNLAFEFATKGVRVNSVLPGKLDALLRSVQPALHANIMPSFSQIEDALHVLQAYNVRNPGCLSCKNAVLGQVDACRRDASDCMHTIHMCAACSCHPDGSV